MRSSTDKKNNKLFLKKIGIFNSHIVYIYSILFYHTHKLMIHYKGIKPVYFM